MTKAGPVVFWVLAIVSFLVSGSVSSSRIARAEPRIIPFTLETEVYKFEENPAEATVETRTEARRSDGSEVFIGSALGRAGAQAGVRVRKLSLADGRAITLDDAIAVKTTWPRKPGEQASGLKQFLLNAPADCVFYSGEALLQYGFVLGQRTAVVKAAPGAANQELTQWRAASLGCKTLKYRLETRNHDGSRNLLAESKPISLKLGEPVPALFDIGESYTELKPSERWRLEARHLGIAWNPGREIEQRKDAIYLGLNRAPDGAH